MSDQQRRSLDNARRADAVKKEDYLPRLREFKSHPLASWTGVSIGNVNAGCPFRTGDISEMSPHDIARVYFRSFKREWEVFLSLLQEKHGQELTCVVRDNLKSRQLASVFRRGYSRFATSNQGFAVNYHFVIDARDPINLHFFYSLISAFSCIRKTGDIPSDAPIYFFIDQIRRCSLAKSKIVFRESLPSAVLSALQTEFESEPESDDVSVHRSTAIQHAPKVTRLEDGSFCLQEERGLRPCNFTTTVECEYCLRTVTLLIEMNEYTSGAKLTEARTLALAEHLRTDHVRKRV